MNDRISGLLSVVSREMNLQDAPAWARTNLLNHVKDYFYKNNLSIVHAYEVPYGCSPVTLATARMNELKQETAFRKANPPVFLACDFQLKEDTMLPDNKKEVKPTNRAVELLKGEEAALKSRLEGQRQNQYAYQQHADDCKKSADEMETKLKQVTAAIKKIS